MLHNGNLFGLFEELERMEKKYDLDGRKTRKIMEDMQNFKVTLPVIGNFSTGKSSMVNAIIEKELLPVDITPETAVPTEIFYGNNRVYRYVGGERFECSMYDLPLRGLTIRDTDKVRIEYSHSFLEQIQSIMLVDLPGFDTNIALHNMALEQYLPNSLAFLLVVACDEPVLKSHIEEFLKILKFHEMPIYVVISKTARMLDEELWECKNLVGGMVKEIFGMDHVKIACVESYGNVQVGQVKEFLLEVQENTAEIFQKKYTEILKKTAKILEGYLSERLDKKDLNTSQLEEKREELHKNIGKLRSKIKAEQTLFQTQTHDCVSVIRDRVKGELEQASGAIAVYLENGNDVNEKINQIIQNAVTDSIMKEFEPRLQKYIEHINECVTFDTEWDRKLKLNGGDIITENKVANILLKLAPVIFAGLGAVIFNAIGVVFGVLVGISTDVTLNLRNTKARQGKYLEAAKQIVVSVTDQVAVTIEDELNKYVENVNQMIEKEMDNQHAMLEKSLRDVEKHLDLEEDARQRDLEGIKEDLERVNQLIYM